MSACNLCPCLNFRANQWRKTLCQTCFHGRSAHGDVGTDAGLWSYARVEGPFSWEQMRQFEAGYFEPDRLLVRNSVEGGPFMPLKDAFPDADLAFLPSQQEAAPVPADDAEAVLQFDPAVLRAKFPGMSAYFATGHAWFFIDAEGETQGPFTADNMSSWFKAGYFWNRELLICHEGWESYVTLESVVDSVEDVVLPSSPASASSPYAAAGAALAGSASGGATASAASKSPSTASLTSNGVHDGGDGVGGAYAGYDPDDAGLAPEAVAGSVDGHDDAAGATAHDVGGVVDTNDDGAADGDAGPDPDAVEWLYGDETGASQGPFTVQQMRDWLEYGYFGTDTLVRHESVPQLLTIGELFPDEAEAFVDVTWYSRYLECTGDE